MRIRFMKMFFASVEWTIASLSSFLSLSFFHLLSVFSHIYAVEYKWKFFFHNILFMLNNGEHAKHTIYYFLMIMLLQLITFRAIY